MNSKAVIEFGFRRIRRILQISEGVIHLGVRPLWITHSLVSQIYRRPSQLDILLQKLFEGWHAESVKQHLNFFATRKKEVKMTIAESCR